jgi:tRNA threonylcarbamoyladenosine biosynthesis protein TsaE
MSSTFFVTETAEETKQAGRKLAKELKPNSVLAFQGELGAGKTTFIKGLISELAGVPEDTVASPTFCYLNIYTAGGLTLYHFDLYRLKDEQDFLKLGFDEYLSAGGICCIEWAEKIPSLLPTHTQIIELLYEGAEKRRIKVL